MGLGAYQAFLRYASDARGQREKKQLFAYAFSRGVVASLVLIGMLQALAPVVCNAIPESVLSFRVVSAVVLTTLVMEYVKSYARAIHLNHVSAQIDLTYALLLLLSTVALTSGLGILGYALAVALSPLLAAQDMPCAWGCGDGAGLRCLLHFKAFGLTDCSPQSVRFWRSSFILWTSF